VLTLNNTKLQVCKISKTLTSLPGFKMGEIKMSVVRTELSLGSFQF
jgi:hypothetical protein